MGWHGRTPVPTLADGPDAAIGLENNISAEFALGALDGRRSPREHLHRYSLRILPDRFFDRREAACRYPPSSPRDDALAAQHVCEQQRRDLDGHRRAIALQSGHKIV